VALAVEEMVITLVEHQLLVPLILEVVEVVDKALTLLLLEVQA
jgi:hypothetical protein